MIFEKKNCYKEKVHLLNSNCGKSFKSGRNYSKDVNQLVTQATYAWEEFLSSFMSGSENNTWPSAHQ